MSLKQHAYHALRRLASPSQRARVKNRVFQLRVKLSPVLRAWYGSYGNADLEAELRKRIPSDFDVLMVHSSISSMQPVYVGSALDLLEFLVRFVGPERTLAMPAFFLGTADLFNRAYYRKNPRFDVRRTPSQMGLVTELFRRRRGVIRSLHPTHSVCAMGPLAHELCATHHLSPWPCGELSPFGVMGRRRTTIVGLGVEYYRSLTQAHSAEEILGSRFPVPLEEEDPVHVELIDSTGKAISYEMSRPVSHEYSRRGERLRDFVNAGDIEEWRFRGTALYVTEAAKVDSAIRNAALRGESIYAKESL